MLQTPLTDSKPTFLTSATAGWRPGADPWAKNNEAERCHLTFRGLTRTLSPYLPPTQQPTSAVHHLPSRTLDETYDLHDPSTFTTQSQQRQQQAAPNPAPNPSPYPSNRHSSAFDHPRILRRTSRYSPRRPGSVDASGRPFQIEQTIPVLVRPASEHLRPAPSVTRTEHENDCSDSAPDDNPLTATGSYWPRRSTRVSPNTASAILWALEEAIRKPFPFTTDWEEVNASMSDLGGPSTSGLAGNGRSQNGASRAAQGPIPVHTHPASGVRTPTDIMRQRRDREARKKAEQEARDREQEEADRRRLQQEQQTRAQPSTQAYPAGVAADRPSQRRAAQRAPAASEPRAVTNIPGPSPTSPGRAELQQPQAQIPAQPRQPAPAAAFSQQQSSQPKLAPQQPKAPPQSTQPANSQPQQPSSAQQSAQQTRRVAFPHAFERWETLSSHWEGLTSYWIRKLEQNNEALERDPLSQQMARQVTDLSAAGANLFHAVVELQRLRASSERKFQRWFFDTRAEQERAKELQAELERQLRVERQARTEAANSLQKADSDKTRIEELLKEMRRELQISKDEARRAWEELGRREQEERERTNSLRNGEPTLVGGVQVVPMVAGIPRRDPGRPVTREGPYAGGDAKDLYGDTPVSPVGTDPFVEGQRSTHDQSYSQAPPPASTAAQAQGHYGGHYYEPEAPYPPQTTAGREPSIGSSEPGEDYGYQQTSQSRQAYPRPMSEESDEYEHGSLDDSEPGYVTSTMPPTSGALYASSYDQNVDYSGSGWGPGWESLTPRHRHPTRLSDVLEEEEPRTTPSRASRASQASRSVQ
ncbi:hypothetical protein BJX63DRAFT_432134 [Aspergillus granulosus]|uniref:Uncharacterized protein n=1 Tax=Aspergillus granulosus TaxID=176169 RepID=A0ABR4HCE7_9EURO